MADTSIPKPRTGALGVWGAMGGVGGSLGVLLGGVLTQAFGWPAIFVVNVPIGIAVIAFGRGLIPAGRVSSANRHFDATGALLVTGALTVLVYAIVRTDTRRSPRWRACPRRRAGSRRACSAVIVARGELLLDG
ncbi:MAG TPA: MFS transporter [Solirubrobacteraceae bacterium]|jgi:MFS family permease|nr:MFS transporter [Solirubrobacteraceae bacterium]